VYLKKLREPIVTFSRDRKYPEIRVLLDPKIFIVNEWKAHAHVWNDNEVVECPNVPRDSEWFTRCGWTRPSVDIQNEEVSLHLHGDYVMSHSWFKNANFGHFIHDHLPNIAWLRRFFLSDSSRFILAESELARKILKVLDPEFLERVDWVPFDAVIRVHGSLKIAVPDKNPTAMETRLMQHLRKWIMEKHPVVPGDRTIIWYTRKGPDTKHSRMVEGNHEQDLIDIVRRKMEQYNRPERLVIYDGSKDGKTMPFEEQFELFRSASAAIGPHGSGLANVIWMDQSPINCVDRPKVLEFLIGLGSGQVQVGGYARTYYLLYSGLPIEYHHVHYATNSTSDETYVNLNDFEHGVDSILGPPRNTYQRTS